MIVGLTFCAVRHLRCSSETFGDATTPSWWTVNRWTTSWRWRLDYSHNHSTWHSVLWNCHQT